MFKLVDVDIDGMMSRVKYMVILGLVCLCVLAAPVMAAELKACEKCTPESTPGFGTECPLACAYAFPEDYWARGNFDDQGFLVNVADDLDPNRHDLSYGSLADQILGSTGIPTGSPLSGDFKKPAVIDPRNPTSPLSGTNVNDDLKKYFRKF